MTAIFDYEIESVKTGVNWLRDPLGEFIKEVLRPAAVGLFHERSIVIYEIH
jgi:hypothetical protein